MRAAVTRRVALSALGALAATTGARGNDAPAQHLDVSPDAELLDLEAQFVAAWQVMRAASDKVDELERKFRPVEMPVKPELEPMPADLEQALAEMPARYFGTDDHPASRAFNAWRAPRDALMAEWQALVEAAAIQAFAPIRAADAEDERATAIAAQLSRRILDMPAQTFTGMLVKLRVHELWPFDDGEVLDSLVADLKAMAERGGRA